MDPTHLTVARLDELAHGSPSHADADGLDLVIVRSGDDVHVFEGRCPHRGALLADGHRRRRQPGLRACTGGTTGSTRGSRPTTRASGSTSSGPRSSTARCASSAPSCSTSGRCARRGRCPSTYDRLFDDPHQDTPEEPYVAEIHALAKHGLTGPHGPVAAMGVPRTELPTWDDLQVLTAQLHRFPLLDDEPVDTSVVIGPAAARPLHLDDPGVRLRHELRGALAGGQDRARARGGGGRHRRSAPARAACSRRSRPSARATSTSSPRPGSAGTKGILDQVQALHLKLGQGAKTGTGGHLPGQQGGRPDRGGARAARGHAGRVARLGSPTGPPCSTPRRSSTTCGRARAASRSG